MKIACCQMRVQSGWRRNLDGAQRLVQKAAAGGAQMVLLPEMFCCPYTYQAFRQYAQPQSGELVGELASWARESGVYLVAGSVPEREGERIYNTSYVYSPTGEQVAKYRKMHLFDVQQQDVAFDESEYITAGEKLGVFQTPFGCVGLAICFDVRFAEMFIQLGTKGADLIVLPAAFHRETGKKHWDLLLRARALDAQAFVAGCSLAADSQSFAAYGHSAVCAPDGTVLARAGEGEEILLCDLDLGEAERVRRTFPTLYARRKTTE